MPGMFRLVRLGSILGVCSGVAHAGVVQVPEGGKPVPVIAKGVVCGPLQGGWVIDAADRRMVTPPASTAPNIARTLEVKTADTFGGLRDDQADSHVDRARTVAGSRHRRHHVLSRRRPHRAARPATQGRPGGVERARRRQGARATRLGCVPRRGAGEGPDLRDPGATGACRRCRAVVAPRVRALGPDVTTFDAFANRVEHDALRLRPSRVVLSKPLVQTTGVDVTNGPARVAIAHPEAVSSVDCGIATCELADRGVVGAQRSGSADVGDVAPPSRAARGRRRAAMRSTPW